MSIKTQTSIALFYFLIAGAFGVFLRSLHVFDFDVNYRFIVHGHSHIALLGWVYICITTLLYKFFIPKTNSSKRLNKRIFLFVQVTLIGMLITFPFQGYALFSIIFSTLFLFGSYWFTWFFFKNISSEYKKMVCYPYIKASLYYLVLSSIGPWALGVIMTTLGSGSVWYRLAIYFYLHFQYNGWMILSIIGLLLFVFQKRGIIFSGKHNQYFLIIINTSVVLTLFLSVLWTNSSILIYTISALGALLQLLCFVYGIWWITAKRKEVWQIFSKTEILIFNSVIVLLGIKLLLQFVGSIPYFAALSSTIIELTIAYLHWVFLGVISVGLFLILHMAGVFKISSKSLKFYLLGFILTEGLIIYKSIVIWIGKYTIIAYYNEFLLVASSILFLSIVSVFINHFTRTAKMSNRV